MVQRGELCLQVTDAHSAECPGEDAHVGGEKAFSAIIVIYT